GRRAAHARDRAADHDRPQDPAARRALGRPDAEAGRLRVRRDRQAEGGALHHSGGRSERQEIDRDRRLRLRAEPGREQPPRPAARVRRASGRHHPRVDLMDFALLTDPTILSELIFQGLVRGAMYALMGIGLSLIFGILGVVNFAHGEFFMLGTYAMYFVAAMLGLPFVAGVAAAAIVLFVVGVVIERT